MISPDARSIYGIVYIQLCVIDRIRHSQGIGRECKIIIPGKHADDPVFFVKKIIMSCPSQIAVQIHNKYLYSKIPQNFVTLTADSRSVPSDKVFSAPIRRAWSSALLLKLRIAENIVIVRRIFCCILQGDIAVLRFQ